MKKIIIIFGIMLMLSTAVSAEITAYLVDDEGNIMGVQSGGQVQMQPQQEEERSPLLSVGSGLVSPVDTTGALNQFKDWIRGIWKEIAGVFQ